MGMDNISDKVNINVGDGGGLGGSAGLAALMMSNRGDDSQSNIWASILPALTNQDRGGFGGGMGGLIGLAALGLIFGRNGHGGLFGGGDGEGGGGAETRLQSNADTLAILNSVNAAKDATTSGFSTTALALSQGFANVKDSVQSLALFQTGQLNTINQNVSEQGCKTREVVQAGTTAVLQRMDDLRIRELERDRDRAERAVEINQLRSQVEITNVNTATANQAQGQSQVQLQFQDLNNKFERLCAAVINVGNQVQNARSMNDTINFGTMAASGNQSSQNTQVR